MQVFIPYPSPIDVARCLDGKRLRKQIAECTQILYNLDGKSTFWHKHPIFKMYKRDYMWLVYYKETLDLYNKGRIEQAELASKEADAIRPTFITDGLCDQHKRRLYTKAPHLYPQFAEYGTSDVNWYVVDGELWKFVDKKRI